MSETVVTPATTPVSVTKLGHLVYEVSDIERSTHFWTAILGFVVSDRNEQGMVFLRSRNDHHAIALVPSKQTERPPANAGLQVNHLAMEIDSLDALFAARAFFRENGVRIGYEGRRGPGCNIGIEFYDPDGYLFEIYYGMDQIGPDGRVRPASHFKRATTLEEAVANPVPPGW